MTIRRKCNNRKGTKSEMEYMAELQAHRLMEEHRAP